MALYHFNCTIRSRSSGSNAVAIAAYNSGERLVDEKTEKTKYYRNKRDTVIYDEILLPENAPDEYKSRQTLWNSVEKESTRKDSQLVRSYNIACQQEFTRAENIALLRTFCEMECQAGKCVDLCVHDPGFHGHVNDDYLNSLSDGNLHAHLATTMTSIDENGKWKPRRIERFVYEKDINGDIIMEPVLDRKGNPKFNKDGSPTLQKKRVPVIDKRTGKQKLYKGRKVWKKEIVETDSMRWNSDEFFAQERALWEKIVNDKFKEKYEQLSVSYEKTHSENDRLALLRITDPVTGGPVQISKDSYEAQEVEKIPSIHLGYKAAAMEARGIKTDRGDINREIKEANDRLVSLSDKNLQLSADIETVEKDITAIGEKIVTEKSYIDKLERENSHINNVLSVMKRNAEKFLGTQLSKLELDELQPLWEKYAISRQQKDYQQIAQCIKNIKVERHAGWIVNQVSQRFTGSLGSKDWNRLFTEAKTAYETKKFAGFCRASIDVLAKNLKTGIVPKSVSDSMDLIKKTVGRELSNAEFEKAAKYKFWSLFSAKNSPIWKDRLTHFALYKQGETNIAKLMGVSLPVAEDDLLKLKNSFAETHKYVSLCNDLCRDINEPYIDVKKYDNKSQSVNQALADIADDKGRVEDYKNRVHRFHVKTNNILSSKKEIDDRWAELESFNKEHEGMKNRMQRLKTTSPGFWLSRKRSFEEVSIELEKEKAELKAAEERLEEQRVKAEREKAQYEAKQLEQRLESARCEQERREYEEHQKLQKPKQLSERRKIERISWGIQPSKDRPRRLLVTWADNTQPQPYKFNQFEKLVNEHFEDIAEYYKGDQKRITSLFTKMQRQINIARQVELSEENGRGPRR